MSKRFLASLFMCLMMVWCVVAVSAAQAEVAVGHATRHDVSPPLAEMARPPAPPTGFLVEVNPIRQPDLPFARPSVQQAPDAGLQAEGSPVPGAAPTPAPSLVFEGLSDDNNAAIVGGRVVPPDTEGDVGLDHYVQWNNLIFAIYDKTTGAIVSGGGPFAGNSIWAGFGGVCQTNNNGDPIVLYDHLAGRWLFSQFAINYGVQCFAISQTGDPRGPYDRWAFTVSPGQNNDYPKIGIMPESYVLTTRDFPSGSAPFASSTLFDRKAMLAGVSSVRFVKAGLSCGADCVDGWQPPHLEGPPPPAGTPVILTKVWDDDFYGPVTGCDGVRLWRHDVDWSVDPPTTGLVELPTACGANFDGDLCGFFNRSCIPQPGTAQKLDPVDELQMYRAQYRHRPAYDSIMVDTTVDAGGDRAAQHWAELRNSGSGWSIYQEGTYGPDDGLHRWLGSIAMDGDGNIALGFSTSSATTTRRSPTTASRRATRPMACSPAASRSCTRAPAPRPGPTVGATTRRCRSIRWTTAPSSTPRSTTRPRAASISTPRSGRSSSPTATPTGAATASASRARAVTAPAARWLAPRTATSRPPAAEEIRASVATARASRRSARTA